MSKETHWAEVKSRLHARGAEFVQWLFPQARKVSPHELAVGSLDGMAGTSLKICVEGDKAGVWRDFSGSDGGNNLLDLLIKARGVDFAERLRMAADWLGYEIPAPEPKAKKSLGKIVAIYDYLDAEGRLKHQTIRFEPKNFVQRRPGAKGMTQGSKESKCDRDGHWWLWTLEGIEPVLYHLPELRKRRHDVVYITEGEKDADALDAKGLLSTTCPMGAKKWRESYTLELAGRSVRLWGDSDSAGIAHMRMVGRILKDAGCNVEVMQWEQLIDPARRSEKYDAFKLFLELEMA